MTAANTQAHSSHRHATRASHLGGNHTTRSSQARAGLSHKLDATRARNALTCMFPAPSVQCSAHRQQTRAKTSEPASKHSKQASKHPSNTPGPANTPQSKHQLNRPDAKAQVKGVG
mgnify:FL=1